MKLNTAASGVWPYAIDIGGAECVIQVRMREYQTLDVELHGDVLRIAFDRPDAKNAANPIMHSEMTHVFKDASETDARVVVLTGNGDTFSAGGDIQHMKERIDDSSVSPFTDAIKEAETILSDLISLEKPIIAKVNGHATGLGATLALFCDIVIASEDAKIGDPHVQIGLVAGDGGAVIWPLLTDIHTAKELLMTGELISAKEAEEIGLINYAVPPDELDDKVDKMVDKLASGPQLAIRYTKKAINNYLQRGIDDILSESLALEAISHRHPDHEEAVSAFLDNSTVNFPSGRGNSRTNESD